MARRVAVSPTGVVRRIIADGVLGNEQAPVHLGSIRLHEHQQRAVARVRHALGRHGGVLLADSVGLGKTYVALAASRSCEAVVVVAPAVLRDTWMESAARANATIRFVSTESLSGAGETHPAAGLVIVDEAHHFRNPRTRRYMRLAQLTASTRVLLLTATPIHNRQQDLSALLALFLGAGARPLTPETIACCVIRREHSDVSLALPRLGRIRRLTIEGDESIAGAILALPPPLPTRDGGDAASLIRLGLLHLWTSSDAAAIRGIRRRLAAGIAMREALAVGRVPARRELRSWLAADDAVQLGFTELLIEPVARTGAAELAALDAHVTALRLLLSRVRSGRNRDAHRALQLRELRSHHRTERVLAFSSYAATVHALRSQLVPDGEVAAVTAQGGWIASGRTSREEVLGMFADPAHRRERVQLLLATDLLSEGLNLQEASVVVHLDLPWTAARLEQRVGRARRPGSASSVVRCYAFVQPGEIERLIGRERLISSKARAAGSTVGAPAYGKGDSPTTGTSPSRAWEDVRRILSEWSRDAPRSVPDSRIRVAGVAGTRRGFLALLRIRDSGVLVAGSGYRPRWDSTACHARMPTFAQAPWATTDPAVIHGMLAASTEAESCVVPRSYLAARRAIARWIANESAQCATGVASMQTRELRTILHRLECALANAPLHIRTAMAAQVSRIRNALGGRLTRGLEIAIAERARTIAGDRELVGALDSLLAKPGESLDASDGELIAVLLLEKRRQRNASTKAISSGRRA